MKRALLIADSGGSKTDWCLCDALGNKHSFTTDSYHPHLIDDEWIDVKKEFWKEYVQHYDMEVHFFGSGCTQEVNKNLLLKAFNSWGIHHVLVKSDILGAAMACFGENDGYVAILGTGSVLAEVKDQEVKKIYGGLGFILGDEGSGFHFGKMLLQKYFHNQFPSEVKSEIEKILGSREFILSSVYGMNGKKFIAGLSEKFSESSTKDFRLIHQENIEQFSKFYLSEMIDGASVSFVGSYAYHNRGILEENLEKNGWKIGAIIERPIERITEYLLKSTF